MIAALSVNGVLKSENSDTIITEGGQLYAMLADRYQLILMYENMDERKFEYWLKTNAIKDHIRTAGGHPVDAINKMRAADQQVALFVSANPDMVSEAMQAGITSILFVHPKYARPSFRPDWQGLPRPWDDLVSEIEAQNIMKSADHRRTPNE